MSVIDVGRELSLPSYLFLTANAGFLGLMLCLPSRHDQIGTEFSESDPEFLIPGNQSSTFRELEPNALDSLSDGQTPPIYAVGPVLDLKCPPNPELDKAQGKGLELEPSTTGVAWYDSGGIVIVMAALGERKRKTKVREFEEIERGEGGCGGTIVLFDRKMLRNFRKDGHNWKKKKDGKTVKEAHEHFKHRQLRQRLVPGKLEKPIRYTTLKFRSIEFHIKYNLIICIAIFLTFLS
ncbi:UDP-glycosyltransferase 71K1-like [Fagus crenata]